MKPRDLIAAIEAEQFTSKPGELDCFQPWIELKNFIGLLSAQFDIEEAAKVLATKVTDHVLAEAATGKMEDIREEVQKLCLGHLAHGVAIAQRGQQPLNAMIKQLRRTLFVLTNPATIAEHIGDRFVVANPNLPPCELTKEFLLREVAFAILPHAMQKISGPNTADVVKKD